MLILLAAFTLSLGSCANSKTIDGKTYEAYGLANADSRKSDSIVYEIPVSNWIMGILFSETIIVPGYIIGWDLYEPVKKK